MMIRATKYPLCCHHSTKRRSRDEEEQRRRSLLPKRTRSPISNTPRRHPRHSALLFAFITLLIVTSCKQRQAILLLASALSIRPYPTIPHSLRQHDNLLRILVQDKKGWYSSRLALFPEDVVATAMPAVSHWTGTTPDPTACHANALLAATSTTPVTSSSAPSWCSFLPLVSARHSWWLLVYLSTTSLLQQQQQRGALHPFLVLVSLPLLTFVAVLAQGAAAILQFRRHFAAAPLPQVPCHGLVVAHEPEALPSRIDQTNDKPSTRINDATLASFPLPLCVMVVGDSLAVGVGQGTKCTPVLPETIARVLSTAMKRPVLWTSVGETGASTPWILQLLSSSAARSRAGLVKESRQAKDVDSNLNTDHAPCSFEDCHSQDQHEIGNNPSVQQYQWQCKEQLEQYRQSFEELYWDADTWYPYDVVVLLTGANDLKSLYFPFLLKEDERDDSLRKAVNVEASTPSTAPSSLFEMDRLVADLKAFVQVLQRKMDRGRKRLDDIVQRNGVRGALRATVEHAQLSPRQNGSISKKQATESHSRQTLELDSGWRSNNTATGQLAPAPILDSSSSLSNSTKRNGAVHDDACVTRPDAFGERPTLFVLPAMPTRTVPAFGQPPMSWLAKPIFDSLNKKKKDYAKLHKDRMLFVEEPDATEVRDLVQQRGKIWHQKEQENIWLNLQSTTLEECHLIEAEMKDFYNNTGFLFQIPDKEGVSAAFFSSDTIHPSEKGYDMFGRHIGLKIAEKLATSETE